MSGQDADLLLIFEVALSSPTLPNHGFEVRFSSFLWFSLGRCWKNEKNRLLAREALQIANIALPCCMRSKTKNVSHAAWERETWFLQHIERKRSVVQTWKFCCCEFWWFWGGENVAPSNGFSKIVVFWSKNQNFIKIAKMEMWLKPLVGARFVANKVTTTQDQILASSFSWDETQIFVKIVVSLESQWLSQVQVAQR